MKKLFLILPFFASLFLLWCGTINPNADCETGVSCPLPTISGQQDTLSGDQMKRQTDLTGVVQRTIQAIKTEDFITLGAVASANGVRFSPYENVKTTDVVLSKQQIINALSISASYTRWSYDGSGMPIDLWIGQYRTKFVYDVDFATAPYQVWNQVIQRGNTTNTIATFYANYQVKEYHFPGFDPQYSGIDRKSLWLIFGDENGIWKLIWVVHGQRTI